MIRYAIVALGGAVGAIARYWLSEWALQKWGPAFPYGTFIVNVTGSFILGLFATLALRFAWDDQLRLLIAVGFVGAFTTFSTFEWESLQLIANGTRYREAAINLAGSVVVGFAAAYAGAWLATYIAAYRSPR